MPHVHTLPVSRRGALAAGGAVGLGALLAACGRSGAANPGGSGSAGPAGGGAWSFTDDRGGKVTSARTPQRVVAFTGTAAALWDFGLRDHLVGVFGETELANGKPTPLAGDLDLDKIKIIGNAYGEFDIEKYAAARPDLLVTDMYTQGQLWYVPTRSTAQIVQLAPTVAISTAWTSITRPIQRHAALAAALGADLNAPRVTAAKARFQAAAEALRRAAQANPGLKVMAASASTDLFYVSNPAYDCDLIYYRSLGVDFTTPSKFDAGSYYQGLSWENAGAYQADLILLDSRGTALQPADLQGNPAWSALPAVRAGQVTPWDTVPRFSYAGVAPDMESLAKAVQGAKKLH